MKGCALLLIAVGLCCAKDAVRTFTGVIYDNRCAPADRATKCPSTKAPTYTLQSGDDAWVLSDQKTPARYVGRKVIVRGTVGSGNRLNVDSIAPAK